MIESYSFGKMVINGSHHTADLIIYPDGSIQDSWWRSQGHLVSLSDITGLIATEPEIIVVGTGANGLMRPAAGLKEDLAEKGIELIAQPCEKAMHTFNKLRNDKKVGGCFHLTC